MNIYYAVYLLRACPLARTLVLALAQNPARLEHLRHKLERNSEWYIPYEATA
jgi:hypothetical protein